MRKNKMMRFASGLLVAVLLTTSIISGTFAKYTTTTSGNDSARVAYWGFNQAASTTIDLFDANYNSNKVKSENGDNVIAPGTEKTSTFAFGYDENANVKAPEVEYTLNVAVDTTGSNTTKLDNDESFKWILKKGDAQATEYDTLAQLVAAIKALSGDVSGTKEYAAGTLPTNFTAADEVYTVGWKWAYDGQDAKDTALGNDTNLENVNLKITITATQKN